MTTLVALATKDALVLGCDSLATRTKRVIDPMDLIKFFDIDSQDLKLKLDENGKPLLKSFHDISNKSKSIPSEHMTHMTKLFSLEPISTGVMIAGATSIGNRTIKSIVEGFKREKIKSISEGEYSIENIARELTAHLLKYYRKVSRDQKKWPFLELILGGYAKRSALPIIYRIILPDRKIKKQFEEGTFGIAFGGQMREIQRIVFGTDPGNMLKLRNRHIELLRKYREKIVDILKQNNIEFEIPEITKDEISELDIFNNWKLEGFDANWGDFSEQNAIECVDFFVNIMIKSQQFSSGMPTVGGEVHIALITKDKFRFISKEEYHHSGHYTFKG